MPSGTTNDTGFATFQATAVAIEEGIRVTLDSNGLISAAGETDLGIGVTLANVAASGYGRVKLWNAGGTFGIQTAGAVTRGAQLYAKASGEVDDAGTYKLNMLAGEAATAQGDIIECVMIDDATYSLGAYASANVGTLAGAGTNQGTAAAIVALVTAVTGGDGTVGVILPTAAAGLRYVVHNDAAGALKLYPNTSDDINGGSANASVSMAANTGAICTALDATTWSVIFTAA